MDKILKWTIPKSLEFSCIVSGTQNINTFRKMICQFSPMLNTYVSHDLTDPLLAIHPRVMTT